MSTKPLRAMILAAGLGTRMRPLTLTRPKPLIEVAGQSLLAHNLSLLRKADIETAIVNAHYFADQIRDFVATIDHPNIILSDESDALLDSGGGIKKALPHLGDDSFFVLNADSFWIDGPRSNLIRLKEAWSPDHMDGLLLMASGHQITGYEGLGDFIMDAEGHLTRRPERLVAPFVYAGVAILKTALFEDTPSGAFSLNLVFNRAIAAKRLYGLRLDGEWLHVGTPESILAAEHRIAKSMN